MADNSAPDNQEADSTNNQNTQPKIEIKSISNNIKVSKSDTGRQQNNLQIKKIGGDAEATVTGNVIRVNFKNKIRETEKETAPTTPDSETGKTNSEGQKTPSRARANEQNQSPEKPAKNEQGAETEESALAETDKDATPALAPNQTTANNGIGNEDTRDEESPEEAGNQPSETENSDSGGEKKEDDKNKEEEEKNDKEEKDGTKKEGADTKDKPSEEPFQKNETEQEEIASNKFLDKRIVNPKEFTNQPIAASNEKKTGKPNKLDENSQKDAASDLNQKRRADKGGKVLNFPGQIANRAKEGVKKGIKDAKENLDPRNIGLDQARIRNEIKKMEKELRELVGDKANKILLSRGLLLLSWIMPGVVSQIKGALDFGKNIKSEAKVAMLQAKVIELKALIDLLLSVEIGTSIVDAALMHFRIVRSIIGFFPFGTIAGATLITLSPVIIPILWTWFFLFPGRVTKIIDDIVKEIREILKPLEEKLKKEKKILYLRRRIKQKYSELGQTSPLSMSRNNREADNQESEQPANSAPEQNNEGNEQQMPTQKAA